MFNRLQDKTIYDAYTMREVLAWRLLGGNLSIEDEDISLGYCLDAVPCVYGGVYKVNNERKYWYDNDLSAVALPGRSSDER